jgi:hypothetical protein
VQLASSKNLGLEQRRKFEGDISTLLRKIPEGETSLSFTTIFLFHWLVPGLSDQIVFDSEGAETF